MQPLPLSLSLSLYLSVFLPPHLLCLSLSFSSSSVTRRPRLSPIPKVLGSWVDFQTRRWSRRDAGNGTDTRGLLRCALDSAKAAFNPVTFKRYYGTRVCRGDVLFLRYVKSVFFLPFANIAREDFQVTTVIRCIK